MVCYVNNNDKCEWSRTFVEPVGDAITQERWMVVG